MTYVWIMLLLLLSYFLGSIPSGLIIGKVFKKIDIRQYGSKNTGATNAVRVLGFRYGVFAFIFDALKGALVIMLVFFLKDPSLYLVSSYEINIASIYGMAAVLGHVWPIYINFKGGKAVATSAGMIFAIEPWVAVGVIILFFIMFFITRYVSLSSTIAASSTLLYFVVRVFIEHELFNLATRLMDLVVVSVLGTIIFIRHKANYRRLREGTELKFVPKSKK
ncbi:MAG: acyl-phosphate glycerol 3-phosphate acyltransferase [Tenericutes bacterium HGW-Tenericutes-6]|jgi:glycerol-3-phosphate acyltransferase PlsY|nr:MAG: acyl-phosphate glycerol 3-phosphate acyltransferase [Tenericutes bacterium HGW-Tenericutes-6]